MSTFVAVAYRYGDLNAHQYFVYAGADKDEALRLAEEEPNDRGGKYGCAVYQFDGKRDDVGWPEYEMVAYFPSRAQEKEPLKNYRITAAQNIGYAAMNAADGDGCWMPDPENPGFLKHRKEAEVPDWLRYQVEYEGKIRDAFEQAQQKRAEEIAKAMTGKGE